jgi:hypothetical protein
MIYLVCRYNYGEHDVIAVCDFKELAEAWLGWATDSGTYQKSDTFAIEEYPLNPPVPPTAEATATTADE